MIEVYEIYERDEGAYQTYATRELAEEMLEKYYSEEYGDFCIHKNVVFENEQERNEYMLKEYGFYDYNKFVDGSDD